MDASSMKSATAGLSSICAICREPVMTGETTLSAPARVSLGMTDSSLARATMWMPWFRSRAVRVMYRFSGSEDTAHTMPLARSIPADFNTSSFVASPVSTR